MFNGVTRFGVLNHSRLPGFGMVTWNVSGLIGSLFGVHSRQSAKMRGFHKLLDGCDLVFLQETHGSEKALLALQSMFPEWHFSNLFKRSQWAP